MQSLNGCWIQCPVNLLILPSCLTRSYSGHPYFGELIRSKLQYWRYCLNKNTTTLYLSRQQSLVKFFTHFPKLAPLLRLLNSSPSELESDSESGGSVRRSRWPEPFLVFFLLLSPSPIRAFNSFLFFIFFWGVSEPAEPDLNPTKSKVLSSLVDVVVYVAAKLT